MATDGSESRDRKQRQSVSRDLTTRPTARYCSVVVDSRPHLAIVKQCRNNNNYYDYNSCHYNNTARPPAGTSDHLISFILQSLYTYCRDSADRRSLRHSRSLKVTDVGTNRKPVYDFLLDRTALAITSKITAATQS